MYFFEDEAKRIAEFLCVEFDEFMEVLNKHKDERCYLTFELISAVGQSVLRLDYGDYNSVVNNEPIAHYWYFVSHLGIQLRS